jgi:hypothetical protein
MALLRPQEAEFASGLCPPCPYCGAHMMLTLIEPEKPGHDLRTFKCQNCEQTAELVVEIN